MKNSFNLPKLPSYYVGELNEFYEFIMDFQQLFSGKIFHNLLTINADC